MRVTPPKGMNDYLPREMQVRDFAQRTILDVYARYGFARIQTPIIEDAENLEKSEGGDNLNLIYQVMKRGDKLEKALAEGQPLWDLGLRYDLTLPLARFYAANREKLPSPFKVIQVDRVYRAERPQKGRMREFVQCDIDIIGDPGANAEVELVAVTAQALRGVGFEGFTVLINDRQILNKLLLALGFAPEELPGVLISFDKLEKIGAMGVCDELTTRVCGEAAVQALRDFMDADDFSLEALRGITGELPEIERIAYILDQLQQIAEERWQVRFSLSLVRGQGYYTGTVFEITYPGYAGSIAGGGRYDNMIGKFQNAVVPAVGFSIGFERISAILMEQGGAACGQKPRLALVYPAGTPYAQVYEKTQQLTDAYQVLSQQQPKNPGKLYKRLQAEGFAAVMLLETGEIKPLTRS